MSVNFNTYGVRADRMNIADLEVGQTLIRVIRPEAYDRRTDVRTEEYKVKKILKTRLVVELNGKEVRLIVDQNKWSLRNGDVTDVIEGTSDSYSRVPFNLATVGEPVIEKIIEDRAVAVAARKARESASQAVKVIASSMEPTLESVEKAIEALTALRDQMKSER